MNRSMVLHSTFARERYYHLDYCWSFSGRKGQSAAKLNGSNRNLERADVIMQLSSPSHIKPAIEGQPYDS